MTAFIPRHDELQGDEQHKKALLTPCLLSHLVSPSQLRSFLSAAARADAGTRLSCVSMSLVVVRLDMKYVLADRPQVRDGAPTDDAFSLPFSQESGASPRMAGIEMRIARKNRHRTGPFPGEAAPAFNEQ